MLRWTFILITIGSLEVCGSDAVLFDLSHSLSNPKLSRFYFTSGVFNDSLDDGLYSRYFTLKKKGILSYTHLVILRKFVPIRKQVIQIILIKVL